MTKAPGKAFRASISITKLVDLFPIKADETCVGGRQANKPKATREELEGRDAVDINSMESFWSMLKRAHKGTFHKISPKHLDRYAKEFAGRHNIRDEDTLAQIALVALGLSGRRRKYRDLITDNGLSSGTRA